MACFKNVGDASWKNTVPVYVKLARIVMGTTRPISCCTVLTRVHLLSFALVPSRLECTITAGCCQQPCGPLDTHGSEAQSCELSLEVLSVDIV
mmetsp:Transcript_24933/g.63499  ORF Transcript_24933/g.63499 Transcript_24933/m.63499 type:complete len:93 (+) Transcript_24933:129-407(+)